MQSKKAVIRILPSASFEIRFPKKLADALGIRDGKVYPVFCGQRGYPALARVSRRSNRALRISRPLGRELLIPSGVTLNVCLDQHGTVRLGPAIGVFVNLRLLARLGGNRIPKSASQMISVNRAKKLDCLIYFYSVSGIDFPGKRVMGYYFRNGSWRLAWLPLPEVIYDRWVGFRHEEKKRAKRIRKRVNDAKIPRINAVDWLNKWKTQSVLHKCPELAGNLPHTVIYRSVDDIRQMLEVYPRVFLKAFFGSHGSEVIMVTKVAEGYSITSRKNRFLAGSLDEVDSYARNYMKNKRFIVQQGVTLLKAGNRSMDFRIFIAKNGSGKWTVVYNLARVAQPDMPITNVALGADDVHALDAMQSAGLSAKAARILNRRAWQLSVRVGCCLEKSFGSLGELGIDVGIDIHGKLWVLEANSKPDRDLPPQFGYYSRQQYVRAIQYSMFLAGSSK